MPQRTMSDIVAELRRVRLDNLAALSRLGSSNLDTVSSIRGKTVREMLWTMHDHCSAHAVQIYNNRAGAGARVTELDDLLALAQSSFEQVLSYVDTLPPDTAEFRPSPNEWNIHEVIEHLLEFEKRYQSEFNRLIRERVLDAQG